MLPGEYDGRCDGFFNCARLRKCPRYAPTQCVDEWESPTRGVMVTKDAIAGYSIVIRECFLFAL